MCKVVRVKLNFRVKLNYSYWVVSVVSGVLLERESLGPLGRRLESEWSTSSGRMGVCHGNSPGGETSKLQIRVRMSAGGRCESVL